MPDVLQEQEAPAQGPRIPTELVAGRHALAGLEALFLVAHEGRFREAGPSAHQIGRLLGAIGWKIDRGLDQLT